MALPVAVAVLLGSVLLAGPGVWAQSAADVVVRDRLIADQENLLNAYRCLFGVDGGLVPGGCPEPDRVSPGAVPANPTRNDLDVRDGLISAQEALLNAYRCRFGIDTEVVAGGCPGTGATPPTADADPEPESGPGDEDSDCGSVLIEDPYGNCKDPDPGADGFVEGGVGSSGMTALTAGATTRGDWPVFNIYDNVELHYGVGSEKDFLRLGTRGELGNTIEVCQDGQIVDLWFYVHNGIAEQQNGFDFTGPGVMTGTTLTLEVDEDRFANSHSVTGSIASDRTNPVTDGITISCTNEDIKLSYKGVSYFSTPAPIDPKYINLGAYTLQGDMRQGAFLGYEYGNGTKGVVPGCWDYRARINVQLEVNTL